MPRLSLVRILCCIPLFFLTLVGLWVFLPSPAIRPVSRSSHIQSVLSTGQPLITVHTDSPTLTYGTYRSNSETDHIAITYQLQPARSSHSINLFIDDAKLNITEYALQTGPYVSPGPIKANVRPGSTDHIINLPWFHVPDAILFHHEMHGFPADVNLRVFVPEKGVVEIWEDSANWPRLDSSSRPQNAKEYLDKLSVADREVGMLARFRNVPTTKGARAEIGGIVVEEVKGELTSRMFGVRMWLLGPLGPLPTIVLFFIEMVLVPAMLWLMPKLAATTGAYAVVAAIWWVTAGRPHVGPWTESNILLSPVHWCLRLPGWRTHVKAKQKGRIWTVTGPAPEYPEEEHGSPNGGRDRGTYGKSVNEVLKGMRIRKGSVDLEDRNPEYTGLEEFAYLRNGYVRGYHPMRPA